MCSRRCNSTAAILGIVTLAAVLRIVGLDEVPPAVNQDEACRAYDAWCLYAAGRDHCGASWPVFFRAFGPADYPPGTLVYLLLPFQALFGMNIWTTRLPVALVGTLNVGLLYLLVAQLYGRRAGLLAALLLAVSPWHLHLSRLAFEPSICPPLLTLAVLLLVTGLSRLPGGQPPRPGWPGLVLLAASGLIFGLALWTYNAMRVFLPLLFLGGVVLYLVQARRWIAESRSRLGLASIVGGFCVGVAPFAWVCLTSPDQVWGRASTEFILNRTSDLGEALAAVCRVYAMQVSPSFLFVSGDPSVIQSVPGYGQLHYFCVILLPLGLYRVIRRRRVERVGLFVLWWILISPLPAALTDLQAGHSLRSVAGLPAYQILAAIGLDMVLAAAQRRSPGALKLAMFTAVTAITLNTAFFLYLFTVRYPPAAAQAFQAEWPPVFHEIRRHQSEYDAVLVTTRGANQLGMLYLFWTQTDPTAYFKMPREIRQGREWDAIMRLGNVYFLPSSDIRNNLRQVPPGVKVLVAERPGLPVPGRELMRFHNSAGSPTVVLYHVGP